ncbi:hypothetical protein CPB85DRAFT_18749 [Mucidula mucida]|nr:hypothetical protein CPB85DRAFT_18749 [Mucidula mucida]
MAAIETRLISAFESFLQIAHEPCNSPSVHDFASQWHSLYTDTMGKLDESSDLHYRIADAMDVMTRGLLHLSVAEDEMADLLVEKQGTVKAGLIPRRATPPSAKRQSSPTLSSASPSREASPADFLDSSTPRPSLSPVASPRVPSFDLANTTEQFVHRLVPITPPRPRRDNSNEAISPSSPSIALTLKTFSNKEEVSSGLLSRTATEDENSQSSASPPDRTAASNSGTQSVAVEDHGMSLPLVHVGLD